MGRFISVPLLALLVALQSSIIPQIRISSGQPELVLLFVIAWSFHADLEESLIWVFVGGIMQDLLSVVPLGTSVIGLIPVVFAIHMISRQIYQINIIFVIAGVLIGTIVQHSIAMTVMSVTGISIDLIGNIRYVILPTLFYNLILSLPIYWIVRRIQRAIYRPNLTSSVESL